MQRKPTKEIKIGKTAIGGNNSIAIQSMTNTRTRDLETTVAQIRRLEEVGCEIVRVAVLNREDAEALKVIKKQIKIPLVADIHFDYRLALLALAAGADKLRINPGNIGDRERIKAVVDACREKGFRSESASMPGRWKKTSWKARKPDSGGTGRKRGKACADSGRT